MSKPVEIELTVNGERVRRSVEPRTNLVDFLRNELRLTGTHVGCEYGFCGACSVRFNGLVLRGCLLLAVQAEGSSIETIEGVTDGNEINDLQHAFKEYNALQCGFCTPGMMLTALELLQNKSTASRDEIRDFISGNFCRCTGYHAIVDAIEAVIKKRGERRS